MREQLFLLTGLLSPFTRDCPDADTLETQDWRFTTFLAGCYLITPSLFHKLSECGSIDYIPAEVSAHLQEIAANAALRNQRFRSQLAEIITAFNKASLSYAILKGGGYLFAPVYPTTSLRLMVDLDVLVAQDDLDRACRALEGLGYRQVEDETLFQIPEQHRHLPPFVSDEHLAAVELHNMALPSHLEISAPSAELLSSRCCYREKGLGCYTLSPTFRVLILIMHTEIIDFGYSLGGIPVRSLEEYAYTVRAEGEQIDWTLLVERFSKVDRLHVLLSFLFFAEKLFKVPVSPALSDFSFMRPRLHYLRCLLQFESQFADRWIKRWSRYTGKSALDRLGTKRTEKEAHRKRLSSLFRKLRRRWRHNHVSSSE